MKLFQLIAVFGVVVPQILTAAATPLKLDIDKLYSLPWITGLAPKKFVWSANSQTVAFLWNNKGFPFCDVWTVQPNGGAPVQLTKMPQPERPINPDKDLKSMQASAEAEMDGGVSEVAWAPDQRHLFFLFRGQLYSVKPGSSPTLVLDLPNVKALKVAPKGNRIAFQAGTDLYIASIPRPEEKASDIGKITSAPWQVEEFFWSSDGQGLAFTEIDDRDVPHRGIPNYLTTETTVEEVKRPFPGEPAEKRRCAWVWINQESSIHVANIASDPMDLIFNLAWSPDSKELLIDKSDLYVKDRRLFVIDTTTGAATQVLRETDPKNVTAEWWADWAPNGGGIYYTSDRDNFYQIYYVDRSGAGEPKKITQGNWAVFSVHICPAARMLFYVSNEGRPEERHLYRLPLSGGTPVRLTETEGTHEPIVSPNGQVAADYFSNDSTPPDLYFDLLERNGSERQVTHSPLPQFQDYRWVAARYVTFPSTVDAVTLHSRLTLPPDFDRTKKYPAILGSVYSNTVHNQWGGRTAHPTWGLDQYLAQQGYVLLNVDIRGSLGYGKAFRQKLALDYGGIDVEDLYSGVKFLESQGYVDMARVGIWGSSYGGLLTITSLFTKPGVYKAGVAGAPATSLFHALTGEMRTMMAPQDHAREYAKASAFLKSGSLEDHLLIIHGMRDQIVLFKDTLTLEQRLILQGKQVSIVPLPDAPHSWDTGPMAQTRFAYHQLISFFRQYLGDGSSAP